MTRYAADTSVSTDRSRAEIEAVLSRYAAKVHFHPYGCWEWIGTIAANGYGSISVTHNTREAAHRVFWKAFRGPIPDGLVLDHLCRNRACVNPAHLEVVTRRENVLRGNHPKVIAYHRGTCVRGHIMDEANTYVSPKGQRHCRACRRLREQRRVRR